MRAADRSSRIALAFPAVATYITLGPRLAGVLAEVGVEVWTVSEDGTVEVLKPDEAAAQELDG